MLLPCVFCSCYFLHSVYPNANFCCMTCVLLVEKLMQLFVILWSKSVTTIELSTNRYHKSSSGRNITVLLTPVYVVMRLTPPGNRS